MPKMQLPIMKGQDISDETDYRDAMLENFTVVINPILGAKGYVLSHPGLVEHGVGSGIDRGGYYNERMGRHFRVSGQKFVEVKIDGSVVELGDIPGTDTVSMAHSFNNQSIVADGNWYLFDGTTFTQITDPDLGSPISHCWIDSYFFFTDGPTIFHTDITDETSIDPLDFATSEISPDPTEAVARTSDNLVIAFNRYTTEWFQNRASDNFAFRRVAGRSVKCGAVGPHSWVEIAGHFIVLGSGRDESISIYEISAGTYKTISNREVDKLIAEYSEAELFDVVVESRVHDSTSFVMIRLPRVTLLYNATVAPEMGVANAWTIVKTGTGSTWRGINGTFDPRIGWMYGDSVNGNIGLLSNGIASQYGEDQEFIANTPLVMLDGLSVNEMELQTIPGHQVKSDNVTVEITDTIDGVTYSQGWWNLYGEDQEYSQRFIARALGNVNHYVGYKLRLLTGERTAFSQLTLDVS